MNKFPLSTFDFFGYVIPGASLLVFYDYIASAGLLQNGELNIPQAAFWVVVAYILGHVIASPSHWLLEKTFVKRLLGHPTGILLGRESNRLMKYIFPGYFEPLSTSFSSGVLNVLPKDAKSESAEALFLVMFSRARAGEKVDGRLDSFLRLYGLMRNLAFSFLVMLLLNFLPSVRANGGIDLMQNSTMCVIFLILMYRYLKFYRLYNREIIIRYHASFENAK